MVSKWCRVHGQFIKDYMEHLLCDGPADGLEVLLVSLVLNVMINVVLDDIVWSTSKKGIDFHCPTVLLSTVGAYACILQNSLDGNLADLDTSQNNSVECGIATAFVEMRSEGGHPLTAEKDVTSESGSTIDTNPDNEFTIDALPWKKHHSSQRSPQLCPMCSVGVKSKGA